MLCACNNVGPLLTQPNHYENPTTSPFFLQLDNCTLSAMCDERFGVQASSTVEIMNVKVSPGGSVSKSFCTGTLVSSYDSR